MYREREIASEREREQDVRPAHPENPPPAESAT